MNYYNEFDPKAAEWLRELIKEGLIAPGWVDTRSICDVRPHELYEFKQCHFFAGIGGWPLALRIAGVADDEPLDTGSCPCQPFSTAGKGLGDRDPRHLWPVYRRLIEPRKPAIVFGEQVASAAGRVWLAGVRAEMEAMAYDFGAADLCAAGVGAPHIRQRLYWMGHAAGVGRHVSRNTDDASERSSIEAGTRSVFSGLEYSAGNGRGERWPESGGGGALPADAAKMLAGWPSPTVGNATGSQMGKDASPTGRRPDGSKATVSLNAIAQLAGWPTCASTDGSKAPRSYAGGNLSLPSTAQLALGKPSTSSPAPTGKRGALNPAHSRWLMGFPAAWDSCGATAMQSFLGSRRNSSPRHLKQSEPA